MGDALLGCCGLLVFGFGGLLLAGFGVTVIYFAHETARANDLGALIATDLIAGLLIVIGLAVPCLYAWILFKSFRMLEV